MTVRVWYMRGRASYGEVGGNRVGMGMREVVPSMGMGMGKAVPTMGIREAMPTTGMASGMGRC